MLHEPTMQHTVLINEIDIIKEEATSGNIVGMNEHVQLNEADEQETSVVDMLS